MDDLVDIYNSHGWRIGMALRSQCHGNPKLLHHTSHVVVFHPDGGRILLQKRSMDKDIQPGKWDTAVGGHLMLGEDYLEGARRELAEELGITGNVELKELFDMQLRNDLESEDIRIFGLWIGGPFKFQREEIDEVRFWSAKALFEPGNQALFTPNLVRELDMLREKNYI